MKRFSGEEKEFVKRLILQNVSLNKISKLVNRKKSTLYHYYKQIKGKKFQEPEFDINFSELEGEIVGIFTGDGSQFYSKNGWHYEVNIHFGNINYCLYVKQLFEKYFKKRFRVEDVGLGRLRLKTESKKIFHHFKNYIDYVPQIKHCTVKLKQLDFPIEFKTGFLRGLIDTDGTVFKTKYGTRRVAFYTTSKNLAEQTRQILAEFGFQANTSISRRLSLKDCYNTYLLSKSVEPFIDLIKPFKALKGS